MFSLKQALPARPTKPSKKALMICPLPGAGRMWSVEKCQELAREVVQQFDRASDCASHHTRGHRPLCVAANSAAGDGNGSLDFEEWLEMMKRWEADTGMGRDGRILFASPLFDLQSVL